MATDKPYTAFVDIAARIFFGADPVLLAKIDPHNAQYRNKTETLIAELPDGSMLYRNITTRADDEDLQAFILSATLPSGFRGDIWIVYTANTTREAMRDALMAGLMSLWQPEPTRSARIVADLPANQTQWGSLTAEQQLALRKARQRLRLCMFSKTALSVWKILTL